MELAPGKTRLRLSEGAVAALQHYSWPGNVRELRNEMERLVLRFQGADATAVIPREGLSEKILAASDGTEEIAATVEGGASRTGRRLVDLLDDHERRLLRSALEAHGYNITHAAAALGLERKNLYNRLRRLKIKVPKRS
jgi:DNA-binding NtrC family response regulator